MQHTFAIFLGCNIPVRLKQYETASRAVLEKLGVELVDIPEFNCCGYPLRNIDRDAFVLSSARNLALAERQNLDMLCLCQCGFGTFRMADHLLKTERGLREAVNRILLKEGLQYIGKTQIKHLLSVLFHDVGPETMEKHITRKFENLKIAPHYGCHALRPSNITQFDNPVAPVILDRLIEITGAESIDYPAKLDCCGAPLLGTHNRLSLDFAEKKLLDAEKAGAHYLASACPFCQIQFDTVPRRIGFERGPDYPPLSSILYPQLLGLSMGLDEKFLGLNLNSGNMNLLGRTLAFDSAAANENGVKKREYMHTA
jgi:heterodisulfide reductase subunit B